MDKLDGYIKVKKSSLNQKIRLIRHRNPMQALGAASLFLSQEPPFSNYPFGMWVDTLKGQILRNHYFFSVLEEQIVGYQAWALTSHEVAQIWIENSRLLTYEECLAGPCVIVMANRALSSNVLRHQVKVTRALHSQSEVVYWKRQTAEGVSLVSYKLQLPGVYRPKTDFQIEILGDN